jgi:hypothetical protein
MKGAKYIPLAISGVLLAMSVKFALVDAQFGARKKPLTEGQLILKRQAFESAWRVIATNTQASANQRVADLQNLKASALADGVPAATLDAWISELLS